MRVSERSRPLRCLVVVPNLMRGGAERQAVLTALALRDQGLTVRVFVQAGPDFLARDGVTGTLELDVPRSPSASSTVAQIDRLRRAVDGFAPDVVITFLRGATARFALARAVSAAARRAAWIVAIRGNVRLLHLAQNPAVFAAQRLWHRAADRVCTNSASLAANLFAMDDVLVNKVVVVPNVLQPFAVDVASARELLDALLASSNPGALAAGGARRPLIGYVGSFQDEHNHQLVAEALPAVVRVHPTAHFVAIGRTTGDWVSSVAAEFRARVDALGLRDHVTMTGDVAGARTLLPGLDVFALPSKLEGSSNALAEAMIAGVATATTPVADAAELVAGAGVVSRGFTPSTFAEAILAALADAPALRERAAARGRALVAERSPERVGAAWASVVEEAVAAAARRETR